ncbi:MAG TPA: hypothetical protein VH370_11790 [Humisphaera sp.]|nr:hypothetical protein [Humisphaera sp.]
MSDESWNFAGEPQGDLERITVGHELPITSIAANLDVDLTKILRATVFHATSLTPARWLVTIIRGDQSLDIGKVAEAAQAMFGISAIRPADPGGRWPLGFVDPDLAMRTPDAVMLVDPAAAQGNIAWIAGGNEAGIYVKNFNWFRECGDRLADPAKVNVADITPAA